MKLQILAILPGKDGKKNYYLIGLSIGTSIHILENCVKICTLINSVPAIMIVLSCSDLLTELCVSAFRKVSKTNKERTVMPASTQQLLQTVL